MTEYAEQQTDRLLNEATLAADHKTDGCTHDWFERNGFYICDGCGKTKQALSFGRAHRQGMYKGVHYAKALLKAATLQDTPIPNDIIQMLRRRWARSGYVPLTKPNIQALLRTRQKRKYRRYLRQWRRLRFSLTGQEPPQIPGHLQARILAMFARLHAAFLRLGCFSSKRKSFIAYAFEFRRTFEILGVDHLKDYFPGLRGPDKLVNCYRLHARICRDMGLPIVISPY